MRRWLHGTCYNKMICAMSSKIIFNEGRQAGEEPSVLKLPVNISTDWCRTRRCGLREGGSYWTNLCMESVQATLSKHWHSVNLNTNIRLCLPLSYLRRMPENWLPYRDILRVYKMPKVTREPHGISVLYHSFRTHRNGCELSWTITSCVTFLNVRIWLAKLDCLISQRVPRVPGHFALSKKFVF
jgi:hypothetical protein